MMFNLTKAGDGIEINQSNGLIFVLSKKVDCETEFHVNVDDFSGNSDSDVVDVETFEGNEHHELLRLLHSNDDPPSTCNVNISQHLRQNVVRQNYVAQNNSTQYKATQNFATQNDVTTWKVTRSTNEKNRRKNEAKLYVTLQQTLFDDPDDREQILCSLDQLTEAKRMTKRVLLRSATTILKRLRDKEQCLLEEKRQLTWKISHTLRTLSTDVVHSQCSEHRGLPDYQRNFSEITDNCALLLRTLNKLCTKCSRVPCVISPVITSNKEKKQSEHLSNGNASNELLSNTSTSNIHPSDASNFDKRLSNANTSDATPTNENTPDKCPSDLSHTNTSDTSTTNALIPRKTFILRSSPNRNLMRKEYLATPAEQKGLVTTNKMTATQLSGMQTITPIDPPIIGIFNLSETDGIGNYHPLYDDEEVTMATEEYQNNGELDYEEEEQELTIKFKGRKDKTFLLNTVERLRLKLTPSVDPVSRRDTSISPVSLNHQKKMMTTKTARKNDDLNVTIPEIISELLNGVDLLLCTEQLKSDSIRTLNTTIAEQKRKHDIERELNIPSDIFQKNDSPLPDDNSIDVSMVTQTTNQGSCSLPTEDAIQSKDHVVENQDVYNLVDDVATADHFEEDDVLKVTDIDNLVDNDVTAVGHLVDNDVTAVGHLADNDVTATDHLANNDATAADSPVDNDVTVADHFVDNDVTAIDHLVDNNATAADHQHLVDNDVSDADRLVVNDVINADSTVVNDAICGDKDLNIILSAVSLPSEIQGASGMVTSSSSSKISSATSSVTSSIKNASSIRKYCELALSPTKLLEKSPPDVNSENEQSTLKTSKENNQIMKYSDSEATPSHSSQQTKTLLTSKIVPLTIVESHKRNENTKEGRFQLFNSLEVPLILDNKTQLVENQPYFCMNKMSSVHESSSVLQDVFKSISIGTRTRAAARVPSIRLSSLSTSQQTGMSMNSLESQPLSKDNFCTTEEESPLCSIKVDSSVQHEDDPSTLCRFKREIFLSETFPSETTDPNLKEKPSSIDYKKLPCDHCNNGTCDHCSKGRCDHCNKRTCDRCNKRTCDHCNQGKCDHCNQGKCDHCNQGKCDHCNQGKCDHSSKQTFDHSIKGVRGNCKNNQEFHHNMLSSGTTKKMPEIFHKRKYKVVLENISGTLKKLQKLQNEVISDCSSNTISTETCNESTTNMEAEHSVDTSSRTRGKCSSYENLFDDKCNVSYCVSCPEHTKGGYYEIENIQKNEEADGHLPKPPCKRENLYSVFDSIKIAKPSKKHSSMVASECLQDRHNANVCVEEFKAGATRHGSQTDETDETIDATGRNLRTTHATGMSDQKRCTFSNDENSDVLPDGNVRFDTSPLVEDCEDNIQKNQSSSSSLSDDSKRTEHPSLASHFSNDDYDDEKIEHLCGEKDIEWNKTSDGHPQFSATSSVTDGDFESTFERRPSWCVKTMQCRVVIEPCYVRRTSDVDDVYGLSGNENESKLRSGESALQRIELSERCNLLRTSSFVDGYGFSDDGKQPKPQDSKPPHTPIGLSVKVDTNCEDSRRCSGINDNCWSDMFELPDHDNQSNDDLGSTYGCDSPDNIVEKYNDFVAINRHDAVYDEVSSSEGAKESNNCWSDVSVVSNHENHSNEDADSLTDVDITKSGSENGGDIFLDEENVGDVENDCLTGGNEEEKRLNSEDDAINREDLINQEGLGDDGFHCLSQNYGDANDEVESLSNVSNGGRAKRLNNEGGAVQLADHATETGRLGISFELRDDDDATKNSKDEPIGVVGSLASNSNNAIVNTYIDVWSDGEDTETFDYKTSEDNCADCETVGEQTVTDLLEYEDIGQNSKEKDMAANEQNTSIIDGQLKLTETKHTRDNQDFSVCVTSARDVTDEHHTNVIDEELKPRDTKYTRDTTVRKNQGIEDEQNSIKTSSTSIISESDSRRQNSSRTTSEDTAFLLSADDVEDLPNAFNTLSSVLESITCSFGCQYSITLGGGKRKRPMLNTNVTEINEGNNNSNIARNDQHDETRDNCVHSNDTQPTCRSDEPVTPTADFIRPTDASSRCLNNNSNTANIREIEFSGGNQPSTDDDVLDNKKDKNENTLNLAHLGVSGINIRGMNRSEFLQPSANYNDATCISQDEHTLMSPQKTKSKNSTLDKLMGLYDECSGKNANYVIPSMRGYKSRMRRQPVLKLRNMEGLYPIRLDVSSSDTLLTETLDATTPWIDLEQPCLKSPIKRTGNALQKGHRKHNQQSEVHCSKQLTVGYPLRDLNSKRLGRFKTRGFTLFPDLLSVVNEKGVGDDDLALSRSAFQWFDGVQQATAINYSRRSLLGKPFGQENTRANHVDSSSVFGSPSPRKRPKFFYPKRDDFRMKPHDLFEATGNMSTMDQCNFHQSNMSDDDGNDMVDCVTNDDARADEGVTNNRTGVGDGVVNNDVRLDDDVTNDNTRVDDGVGYNTIRVDVGVNNFHAHPKKLKAPVTIERRERKDDDEGEKVMFTVKRNDFSGEIMDYNDELSRTDKHSSSGENVTFTRGNDFSGDAINYNNQLSKSSSHILTAEPLKRKFPDRGLQRIASTFHETENESVPYTTDSYTCTQPFFLR